MSAERPKRKLRDVKVSPRSGGEGSAVGPIEEAMLRWSRGDRAAGEQLAAFLYPGVSRFVRGKVPQPRADELVQDVFVRLTAHRGSYIEGRRVKPWVYRIARNLCNDHYRQGARRGTTEDGDAMEVHADPAAFTPEEYAQAATLDSDIHKLLKTIAEIDREAFELIVDGHMTVAEAAEYVECGPNAMKFRLHRARQAILAWLARIRGDV